MEKMGTAVRGPGEPRGGGTLGFMLNNMVKSRAINLRD